MADQPLRGSDLRSPVPTLEPDDAFVARLSALAAAGAPSSSVTRPPLPAWRVGLVAAAVAGVLVGVAWVAGLDPGSDSRPAPPPATNPTGPHSVSVSEKAVSDAADPPAGPRRPSDEPADRPGGSTTAPGGRASGHGSGRSDDSPAHEHAPQGQHGHPPPNAHATSPHAHPSSHANADDPDSGNPGKGHDKGHDKGHAQGQGKKHGEGHGKGHDKSHGHGHGKGHGNHGNGNKDREGGGEADRGRGGKGLR
jgi:hypothetical protein